MEGRAIKPMQLTGNVGENWRQWKQKFEIYSVAIELNAISEKIQCAQLLFQMGEEVIDIFNTFTFLDNEKNKITKLIEKFDNYFLSKKNITYQRYKFFTARQNDKTIEEFVLALKEQAQECDFPDHVFKTELVKTMLIVGINDEQLRENLLHQEYTLEKAIEVCKLIQCSTSHLPNNLDSSNKSSSSESVVENAMGSAGTHDEKVLNIATGESTESIGKLCTDDKQMNIPNNHITDMTDKAWTKATFRFTVPHLSKLQGSLWSAPHYVRNIPWRILAMFRKKTTRNYLGIYLECNGDSSKNWSCNARGELRLLPIRNDIEIISKKIEHLFIPQESDWGYLQFLEWDRALDENNGYIKNDLITIEVDFEVNEPKGAFL